MKYEAIIFDLFGTLVGNFSLVEHERVLKRMASLLSFPSEAFVHLTVSTFRERATGIYPDTEAFIRYACNTLGVKPREREIKSAVQIRADYELQSMAPRDDALETIRQLKTMGYKIGMITNCTSEAPDLWEKTPFVSLIDVPVFSSSAGYMKPDPQIYRLACEKLEVSPEECLFIGDGSNQELTGATQVGMKAVHISLPDEELEDTYKINYENWNGTIISALKEVLDLV